MKMQLIRNTIPCYDIILDKASTYEESTDAIVPDTYPDIARIAYADGTVNLKEQSPQNDRILISGTVHTTILYEPEGEKHLRRLDVPVSFAYIEDIRGCNADTKCFVRCSATAVRATAVNSRKMSITARLCFEITAYEKSEICHTCEIKPEKEQIEALYQTEQISLLSHVQSAEFTILDDIDWKNGSDLELLHTDCTIRQTDSRSSNGRLLLRGDAVLDLIFLDDTGSLEHTSHTIPFTQMLEVDELSEGEKIEVRLSPCSQDCTLSPDGTLSVGIGVRLALIRDSVYDIKTIRDIYDRQHYLDVQGKQLCVQTCQLSGKFSADTTEVLTMGMKVGQYLYGKAICTGIQMESDEQARIKAEVCILYLDDEGCLYQVHRAIHFPIRLPLKECFPCDIQLGLTMSPSSEDSVTLYLSVHGASIAKKQHIVQDITSISLGNEREHTMPNVTLVLRRIEENEQLWDIAREYATTVSAIQSANGLNGDIQPAKKQMLLIPLEL